MWKLCVLFLYLGKNISLLIWTSCLKIKDSSRISPELLTTLEKYTFMLFIFLRVPL